MRKSGGPALFPADIKSLHDLVNVEKLLQMTKFSHPATSDITRDTFKVVDARVSSVVCLSCALELLLLLSYHFCSIASNLA